MNRLLILLISIPLMSVSCEKFADNAYGIRVRNESRQTISIYAEYILPDTLLSTQKPLLKDVLPENSTHIYDDEVGDEELNRFKTDKITIFILSKDTVDKYSWEEIRSEYKILQRYEINNQDLVDMGGSVEYP